MSPADVAASPLRALPAMPLSPRLRWKLDRYRRSFDAGIENLRELMKTSAIKQKVCPACRALVGPRESRCPFCSEQLSALHRVGIRRLIAGVLPEGQRCATLLLAANFLLFGVALLAAIRSGVGLDSLVWRMPTHTLMALGARDYHVATGEWWRLVTAMFLHSGFMHLLFNAWVLFDVGPTVEEMYGTARFLVLYILAGVAGSLASFFYQPLAVMVGASGALFGLIGLMITYGYRHRTALGEQIKTMYVRWAIYGLAFGFILPGIDNAAHIGGLAAGLAFGALVGDTPPFRRAAIVGWRLAGYAALLLVGVSFLLVGLNYGRSG